MTAYRLDTVGHLPFEGLPGALLHIVMGQRGLALGPALYPLEQGAGAIPGWLAGALGGIQMDMGLDKGRHGQSLLPVEGGPLVAEILGHRANTDKTPLLNQELPQSGLILQMDIAYQHRRLLVSAACLTIHRQADSHRRIGVMPRVITGKKR